MPDLEPVPTQNVTQMGLKKRLENSGLIACEACVPFLPYSSTNKNSAVDIQFSDSIAMEDRFSRDSRTSNFQKKDCYSGKNYYK